MLICSNSLRPANNDYFHDGEPADADGEDDGDEDNDVDDDGCDLSQTAPANEVLKLKNKSARCSRNVAKRMKHLCSDINLDFGIDVDGADADLTGLSVSSGWETDAPMPQFL